MFLYQGSYEWVSKMICFSALCLSFQTWSHLLIHCEISSQRFDSQPLSELGLLPCDETISSIHTSSSLEGLRTDQLWKLATSLQRVKETMGGLRELEKRKMGRMEEERKALAEMTKQANKEYSQVKVNKINIRRFRDWTYVRYFVRLKYNFLKAEYSKLKTEFQREKSRVKKAFEKSGKGGGIKSF